MLQYKEVADMSFNFGSNFSSMFSSFGNSSSSSGLSNILGDYASIKNGSYGRLMKAYYKESGSSSSSSSTSSAKRTKTTVDDIIAEKRQREKKVETEESKAYTSVKSSTRDLQKSVNKLTSNSGSLFEEKLMSSVDENGVETLEFGYDKNAIYDAVSDFVKNYNSVLSAANSTGNSSITSRMESMEKATYQNRDALKQLGITINADNSLSINKDTFMKADMGKVQNVFTDKSYDKILDANADMMWDNAKYEQLRANTYTYDGTFDSAYNSGRSYSSTM